MLRRKLKEVEEGRAVGVGESGNESSGRDDRRIMARRPSGMVGVIYSDAERTAVQKSDAEEGSTEYETGVTSGDDDGGVEDFESDEEFDEEEESERWRFVS